MAHKSKKKHVKHQHERELEYNPTLPRPHAPGTKATSAALGAATTHKARLTTKAKAAAKAAAKARGERAAAKRGKTARKRGGIVRSIARAAGKKLAAKPKGILSRAKARVKSMFSREGSRE